MSNMRDSRCAIRGRVPRKGNNHRGGVSLAGSNEHGAGSGDVDGLQRYTSGGRVLYRGKGRVVHISGKRKQAEHFSEGSHESLVSPRHTSAIHTIHHDGSPISSADALVHTARGLDCSPISSDTFSLGRHVARGLNEMTDDDAYDDSEDEPEHPSQQNSCDRDVSQVTSGKKFIVRIGEKFADHEIHRKIKDILLENYDEAWATFRMVPKNVIARMFAHFKRLYCWDSENEQLIHNGFCNVIKGRFRDIMSEWRAKSKESAREAGHIIGDEEHRFDLICGFPPPFVAPKIWEKLCSVRKFIRYCLFLSDAHFVVTGTPSTTSTPASYIGAQRSQEEVQKVRAEMEKKLDGERKSRYELEERVQRIEQMEKELKENEEKRQKQFDEFMRKFLAGNN